MADSSPPRRLHRAKALPIRRRSRRGATAGPTPDPPVGSGSVRALALAATMLVAGAASACASSEFSVEDPALQVDAGTSTAPATTPTGPTATAPRDPAPTPTPLHAPNGRVVITYVETAAELAERLNAVDKTFADTAATSGERADAGHAHFLAIRQLSRHPEWDDAVLAQLSAESAEITARHLDAQRELTSLASGFATSDHIPAWQIVDPEPAPDLLGYYQDTEAETGIEWEYLAAINRIETGLGRIVGLSGAGAKGPMQFLPTTWDEAGIGEGDINDPEDAIHAAGRYLVRRGGPEDMKQALWGYNNHDAYVHAVSTWAGIFRDYPDHFNVMYYWPIYFGTGRGDVWLPSGYRSTTSTPLDRFVVANPWSKPIRDPAPKPTPAAALDGTAPDGTDTPEPSEGPTDPVATPTDG